jgi:hypothetical protein
MRYCQGVWRLIGERGSLATNLLNNGSSNIFTAACSPLNGAGTSGPEQYISSAIRPNPLAIGADQ